MTRAGRIVREAAGLARGPWRVPRLAATVARDGWRRATASTHLYSYATTRVATGAALERVMGWLARAQRPNGGVAAYYSLSTGWAPPYPETTGYIVGTFYGYAGFVGAGTGAGTRLGVGAAEVRERARRMVRWLVAVQRPEGAFPAGLGAGGGPASVFNTGQVLHGLVRAAREEGAGAALEAAVRAGDWLVSRQHGDGRWQGEETYLDRPHTYHTMVAWPLARLWRASGQRGYADAAAANSAWTLRHRRDDGWFDGIDLPGHPTYLHFVAYLIQGLLETGILLDDDEAIDAARGTAWRLLRMFELRKRVPGAFADGWRSDGDYTCLTGNAQLACVWLRLFEHTGDARWLNAALKMNELVKARVPRGGPAGVRGGVPGSVPIWGRYQPLRYINWGAKFAADALIGERLALPALA